MKKTIVIILLTTVWILLFIVGFNKHRNNVTSVTSIQQSDTTSENPKSKADDANPTKELLKREDYPSKEAFMSAIILKHGREKIEFYGKIVDQNNNPVDKVKVDATIAIPEGWMKESKKKLTTTSDQNGLFLINGVNGDRLDVSLSKSGYDQCEGAGTFEFSKMTPQNERHVPDPENPVVFKMWKLKGPEGLVVDENGGLNIPVTGEKIHYDFLKKCPVEAGGDFILSLKRTPLEPARGDKYDWTASLEVIDGGLVEIMEVLQYENEAPENGYDSHFKVEMMKNNPEWKSYAKKEFYFKSRGGQVYGRITVDITPGAYGLKTGYRIKGRANPKGSRNLEYDFYKELKWDEDQQKLVDAHSKEMMDALIRKAEEMDKMSNEK